MELKNAKICKEKLNRKSNVLVLKSIIKDDTQYNFHYNKD